MSLAPTGSGMKPFLKAIGWTIAFVLVGFVVTVPLFLVGGFLWLGPRGLAGLTEPTPQAVLLQGVSLTIGFGVATWLFGFRVLRQTAADLRWTAGRPAWQGIALGFLAGAAPAALTLAAAVPLGGAGWLPDHGGMGAYALQVGKTLTVLAPAALAEELIFRGLPLVLLAGVLGRGGAIVLVGAGFGLVHWGNPNVTAMGLGNIALAGLFLGLMFYTRGGLWAAFGAHIGWNLTLAVLGAPVSGVPFDIPLLDYRPGGPVWLTGGAFGPEGGLLATIMLTAAVAWAGRRVARRTT